MSHTHHHLRLIVTFSLVRLGLFHKERGPERLSNSLKVTQHISSNRGMTPGLLTPHPFLIAVSPSFLPSPPASPSAQHLHCTSSASSARERSGIRTRPWIPHLPPLSHPAWACTNLAIANEVPAAQALGAGCPRHPTLL